MRFSSQRGTGNSGIESESDRLSAEIGSAVSTDFGDAGVAGSSSGNSFRNFVDRHDGSLHARQADSLRPRQASACTAGIPVLFKSSPGMRKTLKSYPQVRQGESVTGFACRGGVYYQRMVTAQPVTTAEQLFQATGFGRCELLRGTGYEVAHCTASSPM